MIPDTVSESIRTALDQLHSERQRIDAAIEKLEGLLNNLGNGEVASLLGVEHLTAERPRRKRSTAGWTEEKRAAAAERMQQYWAKRHDEEAENGGGKSDAPARKKRSTTGWTREKRAAAAERMRRYWADRDKESGTSSEAALQG